MATLKRSEASITAKKDANDKIREKRAKIDAMFRGSDEPVINPLDYRSTLIQALNWYNIYSSPADRKKWALETILEKPRKALLSKLDDLNFRQLGMILRMQSRDQFLDAPELLFIKTTLEKLDALSSIPVEKTEPAKPKNVISIQDKVRSIATDFASEIDGEIDDFMRLGYPKSFTFKHSIKSISGQAAKLIPDMYKSQIAELEEVLAGGCDQLKDSYSHIKTVQTKNFLKLLQDFVSSCTQQVVSARKIKVIKPKAPSVVVAKLKYLPASPELGLKSIAPTKIVDSQEVWFYDVTKRRITLYKAAIGETLSVRGTSMTGYDVNLSKTKVMKASDNIKDLSVMNKKQILEAFNRITTKGGTPNGRTNDSMIIMRVF
jgi:hypothetical protein